MASFSTSFGICARQFAASGGGSASEDRPGRRGRSALRAAGSAAVALLLLALIPTDAYAWTPGTHVYLGEAVLRSLPQLPGVVAELLHAFPYDFLYGSIAADTSMAKKYVPTGRHCHSWTVGLEIHSEAPDGPLRSFALGYLAHLAADAVAHNHFVPKQLAVTATTASIGHSYWESRFEGHLGPACARQARDLILLDHSRADALLDRILSPTIFSTQTNRRIFRGMVHVADNENWQRIFGLMRENSRWDLSDLEVSRYLDHAYDSIIDFLIRFDHSRPFRQDPSGDEALRRAKHVRREALRAGGVELVRAEAERHFGLPTSTLGYARSLDEPLYDARRAVNS
jgi:hypothetical protein